MTRYPRVITYNQWMKLTSQLPAEQRKILQQTKQIGKVQAYADLEHRRHISKVEECDQLKALLKVNAPSAFNAWLRRRQAEANHCTHLA